MIQQFRSDGDPSGVTVMDSLHEQHRLKESRTVLASNGLRASSLRLWPVPFGACLNGSRLLHYQPSVCMRSCHRYSVCSHQNTRSVTRSRSWDNQMRLRSEYFDWLSLHPQCCINQCGVFDSMRKLSRPSPIPHNILQYNFKPSALHEEIGTVALSVCGLLR